MCDGGYIHHVMKYAMNDYDYHAHHSPIPLQSQSCDTNANQTDTEAGVAYDVKVKAFLDAYLAHGLSPSLRTETLEQLDELNEKQGYHLCHFYIENITSINFYSTILNDHAHHQLIFLSQE